MPSHHNGAGTNSPTHGARRRKIFTVTWKAAAVDTVMAMEKRCAVDTGRCIALPKNAGSLPMNPPVIERSPMSIKM